MTASFNEWLNFITGITNPETGMVKNTIFSTLSKELNCVKYAQEMTKIVINNGFEWENINQVFSKIEEELEEVKGCIKNNNDVTLEEELGDLLLSTIILCAYLRKDAKKSLDVAIDKFKGRFYRVEQHFINKGKAIKDAPFDELLEAWHGAKT